MKKKLQIKFRNKPCPDILNYFCISIFTQGEPLNADLTVFLVLFSLLNYYYITESETVKG